MKPKRTNTPAPTQQDRVILKTLNKSLEGHMTLRELHVTLVGGGLRVDIDILRDKMNEFCAANFVSYQQLGNDWHYFITTKGQQLARA